MSGTAEISISNEGGTVRIACGGQLTFHNSTELNDALKAASPTADDIVVDLRPAAFIDTAIIAYIAMAGKAMFKRDKRLKVIVLEKSHPLRVLTIVGIGQIIDITVEPREPDDQG